MDVVYVFVLERKLVMESPNSQEVIKRIPQNNWQTEEVVFDIFREKYGLTENFNHDDKPDFIGSFNDHTLGVEITTIYYDDKIYGKTLKEHEILKDRIVHCAYEKAKGLDLPPLDVRVIFSNNISKGVEHRLIDSLVEIVVKNIPDVGKRKKINSYNILPEGLGFIQIYNSADQKRPSCWHRWPEAGAVETRFSSQLQRMIDDKAAKISEYRKKCDKCWLIIAAPDFEPSSFYGFGENMETICYTSPFEKVFFMEMFDGTLRELKILS
jgi:hypothetical protein